MSEEASKKTVDPALQSMFAKAEKDGIETMWDRFEHMQPQCGFGESGLCCRICLQGPCRINPFGKEPKEGICGARDYTMVSRQIIRMAAGGCAAHSDHGRHLAHVLLSVSKGESPDYRVKDEAKLKAVAKRVGLNPDKSVKELAKEVAEAALFDFMNQEDVTCRWLVSTLPKKTLSLLDGHDVASTNIDRGIAEVLHRSTMGCDADPVPLIFGGIKCATGDLTGERISTDVQTSCSARQSR